jgi:putative holliday junction resolvase
VSGRILGLDPGERRLGFALSDPTAFLASALRVETLEQPNQMANVVARVCDEIKPVKLVVGLPLNMDGSRGPAAEKTLQLVEALRGRLSIPVETWDERLSTKSAHDALIEAGTRRDRRRQLVDKVAAQIMLQNYLDAHAAP